MQVSINCGITTCLGTAAKVFEPHQMCASCSIVAGICTSLSALCRRAGMSRPIWSPNNNFSCTPRHLTTAYLILGTIFYGKFIPRWTFNCKKSNTGGGGGSFLVVLSVFRVPYFYQIYNPTYLGLSGSFETLWSYLNSY